MAAAVALIGGVVGSATPAAASIPRCDSYEYHQDYFVADPPNASIHVDDYAVCIPGGAAGNLYYDASISKYLGNNSWQVVATGRGSADYTCTGGQFLYTTDVSPNTFYCG